jgi:hypothetical protein
MNSGPSPYEPQKKKRGRPPGSKKGGKSTSSKQKNMQFPTSTSKTMPILPIEATTHAPEDHPSNKIYGTPFSSFLQTIMLHNRVEIARVAKEVSVAENTVYRWINGISVPRQLYLKKLPDALPDYRTQLITVINETFGNIISPPPQQAREVSKDIYRQVLEAVTTYSHDAEARFWQISEIIFNDALAQLDAERNGLAITYAELMSPHKGVVHSLREVRMRGHAPWPDSIDSKTFLGSMSLVGSAALLMRALDWSDADNSRAPVEIDQYERSAYAVPVLHGNLLAGVLVVSSGQSNFFKNTTACQLVAEYALLMGVALSDREFYSADQLDLRPMPPLSWQRQEIAHTYLDRIIAYAHKHTASRRDAEFWVQSQMELEFEEVANKILMQQGQFNS